jgi:hypothetical protein
MAERVKGNSKNRIRSATTRAIEYIKFTIEHSSAFDPMTFTEWLRIKEASENNKKNDRQNS